MLRNYSVQCAIYSSYERSQELVRERCGERLLSDQRIYEQVAEEASKIVQSQAELIVEQAEAGAKVAATEVNIYDEQSKEVIWLGDGVSVSEQKARRNKVPKIGKERCTINVSMLQKKDGGYKTIVAGQGIDSVALTKAIISQEYGGEGMNLPVVAITDGARSLKNESKAIFGEQVVHLLDWYHLEAKVYQLMTQIAANKKSKESANLFLIDKLWRGKTAEAIKYLAEMTAKNPTKKEELIGYLEKNQKYIINYERRKSVHKTIGSGRIEKRNDTLVARRQKGAGMAWSAQGALNLALVAASFSSVGRGAI